MRIVWWGLLLLTATAWAREPLLSSHYGDIAYANEKSFESNLLKLRDPKKLAAPGARYGQPVVTPTRWLNRKAVVLTQRAWYFESPYHLVVIIVGTDNRPLYRSHRIHLDCQLPGNLTRRAAITTCMQQQQKDRK
ncbi:hypothetical protein [Gallaecimonas sp. GXIMD1310]|uniref:hypothetical protein n=1 Tax=Gallaecimonas sp. GXIMD1310 TaxID=3131926 RepID=UPI0032475155